LLHGFPEFWWSFSAQLRALSAAGFWAVAPDLRGYNESDKPAGVAAYQIENLVGDVAGLIRALGRTDAHVVGHDWGGAIAWAFALMCPGMLGRLVILNAAYRHALIRGIRAPTQVLRSWYYFFFLLPWLPEKYSTRNDYAALRELFRVDGFAPDEIEPYVQAMRVPGASTATINYYRAMVPRILKRTFLPSRVIENPVLVVWGDRDRHLGLEVSEPPRDLVPNLRVVHIPEATHWVQHDAPEQVNAALVEFLRSDDPFGDLTSRKT
jgi:pimeloyl-ACP methyl ester carboxylesterase